jgi:Protein of unknown function (DUF2793)
MDGTARLALPLIAPGQAQKEMTHNEALTLLDLAVQAGVTAARVDTPPAAPAIGECWIVGDAPEGAWAGRAGALAGWTAGGWRFVAPREGMSVWSAGDTMAWTFRAGLWRRGELRGVSLRVNGRQVVGAQAAAIATPAGGTTVDTEARAAISALLAALRGHGLIDV